LELEDDTHIPNGDLHDIPAKDPNEEQQMYGDPAGELLRLKAHVTLDQTEFPDPELQHPPVMKQPIAAGLDEDIEKEANRGN
jgi:hypothetical protein